MSKMNLKGGDSAAAKEVKKTSPRRNLGRAAAVMPRRKSGVSKGDKELIADRQKLVIALKKSGRLLDENIKYLKDNFAIDLYDFSNVSDLDVKKIAYGNVTSPINFSVAPKGADRRVNVIGSVRIQFPYRREGEKYVQVPVDDSNRLQFSSYPCIPLVEKVAEKEVEIEDRKVSADEYEKPSREQVEALRSVGVDLYRAGSLSPEEQNDLLAGIPVNLNGVIRTESGHSVNVSGVVQLRSDIDGTLSPSFMPNRPMKADESMTIDIQRVRSVGEYGVNVVDAEGSKSRVFGNVVLNFNEMHNGKSSAKLNDRGRELLDYGMTLGPVSGTMFRKVLNAETGAYSNAFEQVRGLAYVVNGGIRFEPFQKIVKGAGEKPEFQPVIPVLEGDKVRVEFSKDVQELNGGRYGKQMLLSEGVGLLKNGSWVSYQGNGKLAPVTENAQKALEALHPVRKQNFKTGIGR